MSENAFMREAKMVFLLGNSYCSKNCLGVYTRVPWKILLKSSVFPIRLIKKQSTANWNTCDTNINITFNTSKLFCTMCLDLITKRAKGVEMMINLFVFQWLTENNFQNRGKGNVNLLQILS